MTTPTTDAPSPAPVAEELEATARRRMAEVANAGTPRGWNGQRARAEAMAEVDAALDAWLEAARG